MEKLTQFDNYFKDRKNSKNTTLPYFSYVTIPNDQGQYEETPPGTATQTVLDPSISKAYISEVTNGHISDRSRVLYEKYRSCASIQKSKMVYEPLYKQGPVGSINICSQGKVTVVLESEKSTVDKIIEFYTKNQDKLKRAVEDINNTYTVNLLTNDDNITGASGASQQTTYKDDPNISIAAFINLLQLPQNIAQLKDKSYQEPIISKINEQYVYIHRFHKQIKC